MAVGAGIRLDFEDTFFPDDTLITPCYKMAKKCFNGVMDPIDLQVLQEASSIGTFYPKVEHHKRRVGRLTDAGYLRPVRRPSRAANMPPPPVGYELTAEGRAALRDST